MTFSSRPLFSIMPVRFWLGIYIISITTTTTSHAQGPPYSLAQCVLGLQLLLGTEDFAEDPEKFPLIFGENSIMTLAQAGQYQGPENIAEYVGFTTAMHSPYFSNVVDLNSTIASADVDPVTGLCTVLYVSNSQFELDPEYTAGHTVNTASALKVFYSIPNNVLEDNHVYYTPEFLRWFFGTALNERTSGYVCDVLASEECSDIHELNGSPSRESCIEQLDAMDVYEGDLVYFDGNSRGCRYLHATFAQQNPKHCPHLSFEPVLDMNGETKCQMSENIAVDSLFTLQEIALIEQFCMEQSSLSNSKDCFFVTDGPDMETEGPAMAPDDQTSGASTWKTIHAVLLLLACWITLAAHL